MSAELVVVSWNLQGRDPAVVGVPRAAREWGADVLLLQEAPRGRLVDAFGDSPTCLAWPLGVAIVARFPHEESGTAQGGVAEGQRPRIAWARLALEAGPLTVASVHLMSPPWPGTPGRRRAQRAAVGAWTHDRVAAGERVVVGGDFNTIEPSLDGLTPLSAESGRTWRPLAVPWMPPIFRIDAIFGGGGVHALSGGTDDTWRGSDHCPVVVRVGLE